MAEGTCTIGRIGLSTAGGGDGDTIYEPSDIKQNGDSLSISGIQSETSMAKIMWRRDQFLGLADTGTERIIPCTFSTYTHLDGFYHLESVTADRVATGVAWSIDLTRIRSWGHPRVELLATYGLITNSHGVTEGRVLQIPPGTPSAWGPSGTTNITDRVNADGFTHDWVYAQTTVASPNTLRGWAQVKPSEWYKGGCRATLNLNSGGTYYTIVGRRSFVDPVDIARLRISNGLIRLTAPATSPLPSPEWWDGAAWVNSATSYTLSDVTFSTISSGVAGFEILRNDPIEVSVRIPAYHTFGSNDRYPAWLDLSIRRGSRVLVGYLWSLVGASQFRITLGSAPAQTAITGGLRDTSNNASGDRQMIVTNNAATIDTANKRVTQTTALGPILFGISYELGGSGSLSGDDYIAQYGEFFVQTSETAVVTVL